MADHYHCYSFYWTATFSTFLQTTDTSEVDFVPNVAHHVHTICFLVDFHQEVGGSGDVITSYKAAEEKKSQNISICGCVQPK